MPARILALDTVIYLDLIVINGREPSLLVFQGEAGVAGESVGRFAGEGSACLGDGLVTDNTAVNQLYGSCAVGSQPRIMGHHQYRAAELRIDTVE